MNAFTKYLLQQDRTVAVNHVIQCLVNGSGNLAWEFMSEYAGEDWSCKPEQLPFVINGALNKAREAA